MAPFHGWGSTASRLQPLRGGPRTPEHDVLHLLLQNKDLLINLKRNTIEK